MIRTLPPSRDPLSALLLLLICLVFSPTQSIGETKKEDTLSTYFQSLVHIATAGSGDFSSPSSIEFLRTTANRTALEAFQEKDFEQCRKLLNPSELIRLPVRERDKTYLLRAICEIQEGKLEAAAASLEKARSLRSSSSDVLLLLGTIALKSQQFEKAEELLQEALWFERFFLFSKGEALQRYSEALLAQDKRELAKRSLAEAQKSTVAGSSSSSPLLLAATMLDERQYQPVITLLDSNQKDLEPQWELLSNLFLAKAYFETRSPDNPRANLKNSLEKLDQAPLDSAPVEHVLAVQRLKIRVLLFLEETEKAASALQIAQKTFPDDQVLTSLSSQLALQKQEQLLTEEESKTKTE